MVRETDKSKGKLAKLFGRRGLQSKLTLGFLALLLSVQFVAFWTIHDSVKENATQQSIAEFHTTFNTFMSFLEMQTRQLVAVANALSGDFAFKAAVVETDTETMKSILDNHRQRANSDIMALLSLEGKIIESVGVGRIEEGEMGLAKLRKQAEENGKAAGITLSGNNAMQIVVVPLMAPLPVAWVVLGFSINDKMVAHLQQIFGIHVTFTLEKGREKIILATSLPLDASRSLLSNSAEQQSLVVKSNQGSDSYYSGSYLIAQDQQTQLFALLHKSQRSMLERLKRLDNFLMALFLVILGGGAIVAYLISYSIIGPIKYLTAKARTIQGGHLDTEIMPMTNDEIGDLSIAFAEMTRNLKAQSEETLFAYKMLEQKHVQMQKLNGELDKKLFETSMLLDISKDTSRVSSFELLIGAILDKIMNMFSLDRASIMVFDESKKKFKLLLVKKRVNDQIELQEIDPLIVMDVSEGVAGQAVRTGEPVFIDDLSQDTSFKKYNNQFDHTIAALTCVPLKRQGQMIGVINLAQCENRKKLSKQDKDFLVTIASQVAIVIENSGLHEKSTTDNLTKLKNQMFFRVSLDREISLAERSSSSLCLLLFDIDHFKKFNDTYGHQTGDLVLKEVAKVVETCFRKTDVVARYGGEEFAVVMPNSTMEGGRRVAEKLRASIENHVIHSEQGPLKVTVSVGIATLTPETIDAESLIKRADEALYQAKALGRNNCQAAPTTSEMSAFTKKAS